MPNFNDLHLNIVAFNNPFPPDLGGLIDVYYRIKYLSQAGVKIHLHTFSYDRLPNKEELSKYCSTVHFYDRKKNLSNFLSFTPFIVKSRANVELLQNLQKNAHPILFEGTHCCAFLDHPSLEARYKIVRMHNVESDYYHLLAKSEEKWLPKIYNITEAWKLSRFDKTLSHADTIATVSIEDSAHYKRINNSVRLIPSSHPYFETTCKNGLGNYTLYHGNLSVSENEEAALFLINKVFKSLTHTLILAGKSPSERLKKAAEASANIRLIESPESKDMAELIADAQILVLPTFQSTGLKLKLLYSLFTGRHCVVNEQMLTGTSLHQFCTISNTSQAMQDAINSLMHVEFDEHEQNKRKELEESIYANQKSIAQWIELLFNKND